MLDINKTKQNKTVKNKNYLETLALRALAATAVLAPVCGFADPSAMETAITGQVTAAKTAGEAILAVVATVLGGFILFKLAKRAANKV